MEQSISECSGVEARGTDARSVLNALSILEILGMGGARMSLADLARQLDAPKTSVHRILGTLLAHDYVARDNATKTYSAGRKCLWRAEETSVQQDLVALADRIMTETAVRSGETAHLTILDRTEVVVLSYVEGPSRLRAYYSVGERSPAYSVASGLAMMASGREDEIALVLAKGMLPLTKRTITTDGQLQEKLSQARLKGYATVQGEWSVDIGSVSAPVFGKGRAAVAAIGISGPLSRFSDENIPRIGEFVRSQAASLSELLRGGGYN